MQICKALLCRDLSILHSWSLPRARPVALWSLRLNVKMIFARKGSPGEGRNCDG